MALAADTSTTKGKIAVMQAATAGRVLQRRSLIFTSQGWQTVEVSDNWDWLNNDYRIQPKPREWVIYVDQDGIARWSPFTEGNRHLGVHVREVTE